MDSHRRVTMSTVHPRPASGLVLQLNHVEEAVAKRGRAPRCGLDVGTMFSLCPGRTLPTSRLHLEAKTSRAEAAFSPAGRFGEQSWPILMVAGAWAGWGAGTSALGLWVPTLQSLLISRTV